MALATTAQLIFQALAEIGEFVQRLAETLLHSLIGKPTLIINRLADVRDEDPPAEEVRVTQGGASVAGLGDEPRMASWATWS